MRFTGVFFVSLTLALSAQAEVRTIDLKSTQEDKVTVDYYVLKGKVQIKSIALEMNRPTLSDSKADAYVDGRFVELDCGNDDVCRSGDLSDDTTMEFPVSAGTGSPKHYLSVREKGGKWLLDPMRVRDDGSNDFAFELELVSK